MTAFDRQIKTNGPGDGIYNNLSPYKVQIFMLMDEDGKCGFLNQFCDIKISKKINNEISQIYTENPKILNPMFV
jgi:hypothetical protein